MPMVLLAIASMHFGEDASADSPNGFLLRFTCLCHRSKLLTLQSADAPIRQNRCAQALVELNRRLVPVEHRPLESPTPALNRDLSHPLQQRLPHTTAAMLGEDKHVLQINPGPGKERR